MEEQLQSQQQEVPAADFRFDFRKSKSYLDKIISAWDSNYVPKAKNNRERREVDIDPKELRDSGKIEVDETFIPDRTIENNIRREQPAALTYLVQSRRLAIFDCKSDPDMDVQQLEEDFSAGMKYPGWIRPWFKCIDGSHTHGSDSVEVLFDEDKPLHVAIEHIGYDKLFYAEGVGPYIQDAPELILPKKCTTSMLDRWTTQYGFDGAQIKKIKDQLGETKLDEIVTLYKLYFKQNGIVYVGWFAKDYGVDDWIKLPEPLVLGVGEQVERMQPVLDSFGVAVIDPVTGVEVNAPVTEWQPVAQTEYPVFVLPYKETEQDEIVKHKGRVFYDFPQQECKSAITSAFTNRCTRSANVYVAPQNPDDSGNTVDKIREDMNNGGYLRFPAVFFSVDPPDPTIIKGLQYLDTKNTENTGQIAAAVQNRQDSRKTAKEIEVAQQETSVISSVPLILFSSWVGEVLNYVWKIVQSQAAQDKIQLLLIPQQQNDGNVIYVNDKASIGHRYILKPAGDIDVVQRSETEQKMMQDWPVIQTTGAAMKFLADLMVIRYGDKGKEYANLIMQGDQKKQVIQSLAGMVKALVSPEELKAMPPQMQQQLMQIQQQVQMVLSQP